MGASRPRSEEKKKKEGSRDGRPPNVLPNIINREKKKGWTLPKWRKKKGKVHGGRYAVASRRRKQKANNRGRGKGGGNWANTEAMFSFEQARERGEEKGWKPFAWWRIREKEREKRELSSSEPEGKKRAQSRSNSSCTREEKKGEKRKKNPPRSPCPTTPEGEKKGRNAGVAPLAATQAGIKEGKKEGGGKEN